MKYILMMSSTMAGFETYKKWAEKDVRTHMEALHSIKRDLTETGEFVATERLAWAGQAKTVRVDQTGRPVTDGVFPESKEFLAGYWTIDVDSPERAYEIAARFSAAPGPGGRPTGMPIEVRQVMTDRAPELS